LGQLVLHCLLLHERQLHLWDQLLQSSLLDLLDHLMDQLVLTGLSRR
jgi:hypothetical protein